jgi:hypothetical protein
MLVDIVLVVAVMHTSGGISSGLGGLLIVFVGAGSLVLPGQIPAIMGAMATFSASRYLRNLPGRRTPSITRPPVYSRPSSFR